MKMTDTIKISDEDRRIVKEIIAKVMLESSCEEPEHVKECSRCLHEYDGLCQARTEGFVSEKDECMVCEKYERKYKPCGTCKYHQSLICRNPNSVYSGKYAYYFEGCSCHISR